MCNAIPSCKPYMCFIHNNLLFGYKCRQCVIEKKGVMIVKIRNFDFLKYADIYLFAAQITIKLEPTGMILIDDLHKELIKEFGAERFGKFQKHLNEMGDLTTPSCGSNKNGI